jgi:intracellular sulfur oxidation DsrE/DsrF family protein
MNKHPRRGFLSAAAAAALSLVTAPLLPAQSNEPNEDWLRGLNGKHRQFFDVGAMYGGAPLRRVHNFLATYSSAYGIAESDVNALFGAHGAGLPFVLSDTAWHSYELGEMHNVRDASGAGQARRNIFAIDGGAGLPVGASIERLRSRGVRFLACNNTLGSLSRQLADKHGTDASSIHQELTAALLPGVIVVPAMLIAGNRAQEEGLTYASLG